MPTKSFKKATLCRVVNLTPCSVDSTVPLVASATLQHETHTLRLCAFFFGFFSAGFFFFFLFFFFFGFCFWFFFCFLFFSKRHKCYKSKTKSFKKATLCRVNLTPCSVDSTVPIIIRLSPLPPCSTRRTPTVRLCAFFFFFFFFWFFFFFFFFFLFFFLVFRTKNHNGLPRHLFLGEIWSF